MPEQEAPVASQVRGGWLARVPAGGWLQTGRRLALVLLGVAYPVASYESSRHVGTPWGTTFALLPLMGLLLALAWRGHRRVAWLALWAFGVSLLWWQRTVVIQDYRWAYLVDYAGSLTFLAWMFGRTLRGGQMPLVSRFSLLAHGCLSPLLVRYTRWVTIVWTVVLAFMALVSVSLFLLAPLRTWSWFTSVLSGPLLVGVFLLEYAVRRMILPPGECAGLRESIQVCYRHWHRLPEGSAQPDGGLQSRALGHER